jgi:hypothetical protein
VPELSESERELQQLSAELRKLEGEYTMYFAGRLPRPPWETRGRVDQLFKRWDKRPTDTLVTRFRLQTLQTRYSRFVDLWDRALRQKEEGRPAPNRGRRQDMGESDRSSTPDLVHVATFRDPLHEMEKLHGLYDSLMDARRTAGEDVVPFHKFADLVKEQVHRLKSRGSQEVTFRVTALEGRVNLTAKAAMAPAASEPVATE